MIHFDVGSIWWIATVRNSTFVLHLADDGGLGADWWGGGWAVYSRWRERRQQTLFGWSSTTLPMYGLRCTLNETLTSTNTLFDRDAV